MHFANETVEWIWVDFGANVLNEGVLWEISGNQGSNEAVFAKTSGKSNQHRA